jgi:cation diffusion facilitator CzcD-associated flavoprotein CzcO
MTDAPAPPLTAPAAHADAVVVGAGPYGLSAAAHLLGRGLRVAVFGKTVELWREHMPKGLLLRSHGWATNLSDPRGEYGFERFLRESKYGTGYPVPRNAFIEYARWFQERAVPDVDETYVASIEREQDGFLLTLQDGRKVRSAAVVLATGLYPHANRPEPYTRLPAGLVSHCCDHNDLGRFKGKQVIVIGGGQSAIEYSALLHEAGAAVDVVSRRPILWLGADRANQRTFFERIRAPRASIAPGWINWTLDRLPYLFYRLPPRIKERAARVYFMATAADWLRQRVIGKVTLHEGRTVAALDVADGRVDATLSDGERLRADHLLLGTGYKVDLDRLTMIHPSLRAEIRTDRGVPILSPWFESSVAGLYLVGLPSLDCFGPLFRFVAGCTATAARVASSVARRRAA